MDMKLEVVIIPVSDVDRAKAFYAKLGFAWISITPLMKSFGLYNSLLLVQTRRSSSARE